MSQSQLADLLFVSRDLVSKWETGRRRPDRGTIKKLADLFSVEADDISGADADLLAELSECIPSSQVFRTEDLPAHINYFLRGLSERDRQIFIRRYYFTDDIKMISSSFGISAAHVRTILARTRIKLKNHLTEHTDDQ